MVESVLNGISECHSIYHQALILFGKLIVPYNVAKDCPLQTNVSLDILFSYLARSLSRFASPTLINRYCVNQWHHFRLCIINWFFLLFFFFFCFMNRWCLNPPFHVQINDLELCVKVKVFWEDMLRDRYFEWTLCIQYQILLVNIAGHISVEKIQHWGPSALNIGEQFFDIKDSTLTDRKLVMRELAAGPILSFTLGASSQSSDKDQKQQASSINIPLMLSLTPLSLAFCFILRFV